LPNPDAASAEKAVVCARYSRKSRGVIRTAAMPRAGLLLAIQNTRSASRYGKALRRTPSTML
jgi:hypothetical protein